MTGSSMGMADFFTMEATDYLERLDALVSQSQRPEATDFLRLARALRGSAVMANQQQISAVAGGLEGMARSVAERRVEWDEGTRQLAIRTVDDLKVLVRAIRSWSEAEDARAQQIASELERFSTRSTVSRRMEATGLDPGTRAFIAREGEAVSAALNDAALLVATGGSMRDGFESVSRAMQPLRGIASLSELPPFPDLLEGVERALSEIQRRPSDGRSGELLDLASRAVSDVAQQISAGGAELASAETDRFAELLGQFMDLETDVVPIQHLFHDDEQPHIVEKGSGTPSEPLGRVELVSHLEYLIQGAYELERARSAAQRQLRIFNLAPTLRVLSAGAGGPLVETAAQFADQAKLAIESGAALAEPGPFAASLRAGGQILNEAAQAPQLPAAERLRAAVTAFARSAPAPTPAPPQVVPEPAAPASRSAAPAPAEPGPADETDLAAAYSVRARFTARDGNVAGTLEELVAGPPPPLTDQAPATRPGEPGVVPITDLQYDPAVAIARAGELRPQVRIAVAGGDMAAADALLDEIFDLVQLGKTAG